MSPDFFIALAVFAAAIAILDVLTGRPANPKRKVYFDKDEDGIRTLKHEHVVYIPKEFHPYVLRDNDYGHNKTHICLWSPIKPEDHQFGLPSLYIPEGYEWDGASGPTKDTPGVDRPALEHDALYDLIRQRKIPIELRKVIDRMFYRHLREDGVHIIRCCYFYLAVRLFGKKSAMPVQ